VGRQLAYPHHYQTRSRGLDEAPTELVVTNKEEDSDTEASCYDCAWLSLTALSTVTCNLWL
jgi:hypothetical protein